MLKDVTSHHKPRREQTVRVGRCKTWLLNAITLKLGDELPILQAGRCDADPAPHGFPQLVFKLIYALTFPNLGRQQAIMAAVYRLNGGLNHKGSNKFSPAIASSCTYAPRQTHGPSPVVAAADSWRTCRNRRGHGGLTAGVGTTVLSTEVWRKVSLMNEGEQKGQKSFLYSDIFQWALNTLNEVWPVTFKKQ